MMAPRERQVTINGEACRVWEKGDGPIVGYLAGIGGLPRWTPFLDRLAARHRVIVPSLPGFPGARGHDQLDSTLDWITATLDLLRAAGLEGADLVGSSIGGALAAEVAALTPTVRRLVLIGPLGLYDPAAPPADMWAQKPGALPALLSADAKAYAALMAPPEGIDVAEWSIIATRANEAAARFLWPLGDTRLERRLHRIRAETLLVWGSADRVLAPSYVDRFAARIGRHARAIIIPGAGHLADLDAPDAVADAVLAAIG